MASVKWDKKAQQFIIAFRRFNGSGSERRNVRVQKGCPDRETAKQLAETADELCRLLEQAPTEKLITKALAYDAITESDAESIRSGAPRRQLSAETSVIGCWERHPSTRREREKSQDQWDRHYNAIKRFVDHTDARSIEDITLEVVQDWIAHLKAAGFSWDTRRHSLLTIRRAAVMGATLGYPNRIGSLKLDEREDPPEVLTWQLDELATIWEMAEPRWKIVTGLSGFMGLRLSEVARAICSDIEGDIISIGLREKKNNPSRRDLVIPAPLLAVIRDHIKDKKPDSPIVTKNDGEPYKINLIGRHATHSLKKWTGKSHPAKALRKSFATWAVENNIDPFHLEHYLGHESSLVTMVTNRHYLARLRAEKLRPTAEHIGRIMCECARRIRPKVGM